MKDKLLRQLIYGNHGILGKRSDRCFSVIYPARDDDDKERKITYSSGDGVILYLLKRIEKLEEQLLKENRLLIKGRKTK